MIDDERDDEIIKVKSQNDHLRWKLMEAKEEAADLKHQLAEKILEIEIYKTIKEDRSSIGETE